MEQLDLFKPLGDVAAELAGSLRHTEKETVPATVASGNLAGTERDDEERRARSELEATPNRRDAAIKNLSGVVFRASVEATPRRTNWNRAPEKAPAEAGAVREVRPSDGPSAPGAEL